MPPLATVRACLTALAAAPADTRRERMVELQEASTALAEKVAKTHTRLIAMDAWLTAHEDDPGYAENEARYLALIARYQEGHNMLGEALAMVGEERE